MPAPIHPRSTPLTNDEKTPNLPLLHYFHNYCPPDHVVVDDDACVVVVLLSTRDSCFSKHAQLQKCSGFKRDVIISCFLVLRWRPCHYSDTRTKGREFVSGTGSARLVDRVRTLGDGFQTKWIDTSHILTRIVRLFVVCLSSPERPPTNSCIVNTSNQRRNETRSPSFLSP